jgi:phage gp16-like protein
MATDRRTQDLKLIHVALRQLGMDDATYRGILWACGRVTSAKDLDHAGRQLVIEHFKRCGFKVQAKQAHPGRPTNLNSANRGPLLSKIEALLADAGRPWAYVDGMAKKMFGVDRVQFCHEQQLHRLVAALIYDKKRRARKGEGDAKEESSRL